MHGETLVLMLQRTERYDPKSYLSIEGFKIATWSRKFLNAVPGGGGKYTVKYFNFYDVEFKSNWSVGGTVGGAAVSRGLWLS